MYRRPAASSRAALGAAAALALVGLWGCSLKPAVTRPPPAAPVAVVARIELTPLGLSPDGDARLLVRVRYRAADGTPAHIPPGGQVDVTADRGSVQWQPRARYGDPAAIVRLTSSGPVRVRVTSDIPHLPHAMSAASDTAAWHLPPVTAGALGPHVAVVGWFPRVEAGSVRITRVAADGRQLAFDPLPGPVSSFRDRSVVPGVQYTYAVDRPDAARSETGVGIPSEGPPASVAALQGKAMWLSFDDGATRWKPDAMAARAQHAGIAAVELRLTYGEFDEVTPLRKPAVDQFIDAAAARRIAILAWTVPRAVSFEDLAANVAALRYRTAAGNGPLGLAVDLERGADFLGTGAAGYAALATYLAWLREAVGPRTLLVATVEDPHLESLTNAQVPYRAIAAAADVLQPMVYWRAHAAGASIAGMRTDISAAAETLRELAGRDVPLDIGGQTAALGNPSGAPPPTEVAASIDAAHATGAIGETFYDWDGTTAPQWTALERTPWPLR